MNFGPGFLHQYFPSHAFLRSRAGTWLSVSAYTVQTKTVLSKLESKGLCILPEVVLEASANVVTETHCTC